MSIIDDLELSVRTANVLRNLPPIYAVNTIEDFMALRRDVVMEQRRAGVKTWREIERTQRTLLEGTVAPPTPPEHPTCLPDDVAARIAAVAAAYGYRVQYLTLEWVTTIQHPPTARVTYDSYTMQVVAENPA